MLGAVLMKRGKDGKDRILGAEDAKPKESMEEVSKPQFPGIPLLRYDLLEKIFANRPKTYERLIHDLYTTGWSVKEVKELLDKGPEDLV